MTLTDEQVIASLRAGVVLTTHDPDESHSWRLTADRVGLRNWLMRCETEGGGVRYSVELLGRARREG